MIKKTIFLLFFAACAAMGVAQSEVRSAAAEEQHQLCLSEFRANNLENAAAAGEKELSLLRQEDKTDSLQLALLPLLGRIYFRMEQVDRAIQLNEEGIALCLKNQLEGDVRLAVMYDNIAFYYTSQEKYDQAWNYSQQAVAIYLQQMPNNLDMAITLMHAAECAYNINQFGDAVLYQEHSCRLYSELATERSSTYLSELDYLIKYCKAAGQEDRAKELEETKERLKNEMQFGYIPMQADLSTAEKCRMHNEDAYYASRYFLSHYIVADSMFYIGRYLFNFATNSSDVHVFSAGAEQKWMGKNAPFPYMVAYFAGFILHQLSEPEDTPSLNAYKQAIIGLTVFYIHNKEFLGKNSALEKYEKLYKKNTKSDFYHKIEKDYLTYQKEMLKGKLSKVKLVEQSDRFVVQPTPDQKDVER